MKLICQLLFMLSLAVWLPSIAATASAQDAIHVQTLPNGLTVVFKQDTRAPVTLFGVWYKVGSGQEPLGITGISHMLEHMMFRGTDQVPDQEFARLIAEAGGFENAGTGRDSTGYFELIPTASLPLAMRLEADRMTHLHLENALFTKERQVVREERNQRINDQPLAVGIERLLALANPGNPYQNPVIGWPGDMKNYTVDRLYHWYYRWYQPKNAVIVGVGSSEPEAFFKLVTHYFAAVQNNGNDTEHLPHAALEMVGKRKATVKWGTGVHAMLFTFNVPGSNTASPRWIPYALEVLAYVLAGDSHALLEQRLVQADQVASYLDISYSILSRYNTNWSLSAIPAKGKTLDDVRKAVLAALFKLSDQDITDERVALAKTNLVSDYIFSRDDLLVQARDIGATASLDLPITTLSDYQSHIRSVTTQQVLEIAHHYLQIDNLSMVKVLPAEDIDENEMAAPQVVSPPKYTEIQ